MSYFRKITLGLIAGVVAGYIFRGRGGANFISTNYSGAKM